MAAVLAFSAVRNQDRVGLVLFAEEVEVYVPPAKGLTHVLRLVREALYHTPRGTGTRLKPALDFVNRVARRRTVTFLLSDLLSSDKVEQTLRVTARRHDLIAVRVSDRREQAWPRAGVVEWEDAETGRRRLLDTSSAQVRRALTEAYTLRAEERRSMLRGMGIDLIEVETGEPYERAFLRFFQARELRRKF